MTVFLWGALLSPSLVFVICVTHLVRLRLTRTYAPTCRFAVAVIVPCKGNDDPDFEQNLRNIICQEYDGPVQFLLCIESEDDPALATLQQLAAHFPHVQICVAGLATTSAQKTHNILKGVLSASPETEIFALADADIQPHATWLQELVGPFCDAKVGATTGFYRRVPIRAGFHWGDYLAGLLATFIGVGIADDTIKGLWGGSMAVRKEIMDRYNIYERLATEIVDDIAIMHALHEHHIERRYVRSCTVKTYCAMSVAQSVEWFTRQAQFSQVYFKWLYASYYLVVGPYSFYILTTPWLFCYGLLVQNSFIIGAIGLFWLLVIITGMLLSLTTPMNRATLVPGDTPYRLHWWVLVAPLAFVSSTLALFKTYARVRRGVMVMCWRGIAYRVNVKTGKVLEVRR